MTVSSQPQPSSVRGIEPGWYGADPEDPSLKVDPHARYHHLRQVQPVNLTPTGEWRLTRYADIQKLLKNSRCGMRDLDGLIPGETREETEASRFMLRMDPPDHDRLRLLVNKAFTPRALEAIRPAIQPLVDAELDRVRDHGHMDLVEDLAMAVPAASMCAMLGVPFEDRIKLSTLVSVATYRLAKRSFPSLQEQAEQAITELAEYMFELIEERRRHPSDNILGKLVAAEEAGDRLNTEELLQQSIGLLIAGLETTQGLIANSMVCFSRHPDQFQRLRDNPDLIDTAVEECLRFEPSIPMTVRVLWEDTEFSGITIPANATVWPVMIAGNRDPEVYSDPDTFDIGRREARQCSFGGGIHFCLGSHLARLNTEVALLSMAARFERVNAREEQLEWAPSLFRVPGKLPADVVVAKN